MHTGIENIVGEVSDEGLTDQQRYTLGQHLFTSNIENMRTVTGNHFDDFLFPSVTKSWVYTGVETDKDSLSMRGATSIWASNALQIFLLPSDKETYTDWRKSNKLPGFAGERLPDHRLPCANVWYETSYIAGKYPTLVPIRDPLSVNLIKVKKVAIHAIHRFNTNPFPDKPADPRFLKDAAVIAHVQDALDNVYVFAGNVSYGEGGALMWMVKNLDELNAALHNQPPRPNAGGPLSNLSQFVCGELANLIAFYGNEDYDAFKEAYNGNPETETRVEYEETNG